MFYWLWREIQNDNTPATSGSRQKITASPVGLKKYLSLHVAQQFCRGQQVSGLKQSRVQSLCLSSHCAMGAVHKAAASSGTALRQSMQGHQNNVFPPQVCLENNFKKKRRKKGPPQTLFNQNFILRSLTQARSALSRSSISTICCVCLYLEQVFTDYHGKENLP